MLHEIYTLDRFALTIEGKPRALQATRDLSATGYGIVMRTVEQPQIQTTVIEVSLPYMQKRISKRTLDQF